LRQQAAQELISTRWRRLINAAISEGGEAIDEGTAQDDHPSL